MQDNNSNLIRRKELIEYLGINGSTLWRWRQSQSFPKEIRLGPNSIAWRRSTINKWIEQRTKNH
ncbi:hypothetical protein BAE46_13500 [Glaciecola punicea]|nr:hypothetical protein BAE46_13500 [Glaciecola punicea]